ncbi:MAG: hypothetical protein HQ477_09760 [Chloroflexi bacterium]|nr:hypothetical protein [Chloroflexota bacterium]
MPRISRTTILVSFALMIAIVAAACDTAATKPTAEPPTPVPTVASQIAGDESSSGLGIREALADPEVLKCLTEQLGGDFDPESGAIGPELFGRLGPQELAMLDSCGVDAGDAVSGFAPRTDFTDPAVQACLAGELGMDVTLESGEFDRGILRTTNIDDLTAAYAACGIEQARRPDGGGFGGGGFVGSGIADPEIRQCITDELGADALSQLGRGSGLGLTEESTAAFEKCGFTVGDAGGFGGGGIFGGGQRGGARGGLTGGIGDFRECITAELGEGALTLLGDPTGAPQAEFQAALEKCGGGISIPVEPNGGIGDGAVPIPVEPAAEPTATAIPVSDLTIEQLTCLSTELDSSALASAVIATSSGDLSKISDQVLAALQTCGVGS